MRMLTMSHASGSSPTSTPSQGDSPPGTDAASTAGTVTTVVKESDSTAKTTVSTSTPVTNDVTEAKPKLAKSAPIGQEWEESTKVHKSAYSTTNTRSAGCDVGLSRSTEKITIGQKKTVAQYPVGFPPGPEPNSWEAVATSWILPDMIHVIWRALLLATTIGVFVTGLKVRPVSVFGFSFDAYVMSILTAGLLLLPCVIALVWNDGNILDSATGRWIWAACAAMLLFNSALVTVSWMGYRVHMPEPISHRVSEGHWVLSILFQIELSIDAIRLTVGHLVAAYVMGGIYILLVRARLCGPPWLFSLLVQSGSSFIKVCVAFLATVTVMFLLVRARTVLTDSLERRRERVGMASLTQSDTLHEVTAR